MRGLRRYRPLSAQTYDPHSETKTAFGMINNRQFNGNLIIFIDNLDRSKAFRISVNTL